MNIWKDRSALWLAMAIILSTATQLRLNSLPVGPGETMLVLWIIASSLSLLISKRRLRYSSVGKTFLTFWIISFGLLVLGFSFAFVMGLSSNSWYHDALAYGLIFVLIFLMTSRNDFDTYIQQVSKIVLIGSVISLFILLIIAQYINVLGPFNFWFGSIRFRGWSKNPNQVALLMSMAPSLAGYYLFICSQKKTRFLYILLITFSIVTGIATKSDSFTVSMLGSLGIFFVWFLSRFVLRINPKRRQKITRRFLIFFWLLTVAIPVRYKVARDVDLMESTLDAAMNVYYSQNNQGKIRFLLWGHGIEAMIASPLFGLGPGSHSGVHEAHRESEVHNVYLDWGTNTGLIGFFIYIKLLVTIAWQTRKTPMLLSAIIAVSLFSLFAHVIRHPFFWCYLMNIANLTRQNKFKKGGIING